MRMSRMHPPRSFVRSFVRPPDGCDYSVSKIHYNDVWPLLRCLGPCWSRAQRNLDACGRMICISSPRVLYRMFVCELPTSLGPGVRRNPLGHLDRSFSRSSAHGSRRPICLTLNPRRRTRNVLCARPRVVRASNLFESFKLAIRRHSRCEREQVGAHARRFGEKFQAGRSGVL